MDVLRGLFDLVIIVAYYATAFIFGSWLMAAAPIALALVIVVVTLVRARIERP